MTGSAANSVSALVEGTASIESASRAERAAATRPKALEPRIYDEARHNGAARDANRQQTRATLVASNSAARASIWPRRRHERASTKSRHRTREPK